MNAIILAPDEHLDRLRSYCSAMKWRIVGEYAGSDLDNATRRGCKTTKGVLVVCSLDRIGEPGQVARALKLLKSDGCQLVALDEQIDTVTHPAFWQLVPWLARLAPNGKPRKTKGKGPIRYGWKRGDSGDVPDDEEQAILQRARDMIAEGESLRGVCRRLDEAGIKKRGKKWAGQHRWLGDVLRREAPGPS